MPAVLKRAFATLGLLLILVTAAVFALPLWMHLTEPEKLQAQAGEVNIYVIGNGWHAGLLLPASAINARLPALKQRFPDAKYYEIGWGDVGFYRAKAVTAGLAFEAMFASRGSVMHVVGVPDVKQFLQGSDSASLCIDDTAYQQMVTQIAASFARNDVGASQGNSTAAVTPIDAGPGIYGNSQFYIANGSYGALNTCNRWTASALQAAGISTAPRMSLTASSVLGAARHSARRCTTPR